MIIKYETLDSVKDNMVTEITNIEEMTMEDLNNLPSMEELLSQEAAPSFVEGTIVKGVIAEKRDKEVLIDIGYKAEGSVSKEEFSNWDEVEVGQSVDVYLEQIEDDYNNMPVVSVRKAQLQKAWDDIVANYNEGEKIKGVIKHRVRGGLIVDVGVDAFLPGSQVDVGPVRNLEEHLGNEEEFKILKINPERRNIVLSRRELLEEIRKEQRAELLGGLEAGEIRMGVVKNITDFGAFVDLSGMDGLLHITDMSWGRVSHPSEVVKVGEEIEVMILDVDRERQRVSLGLKQKEGNPWDTVEVKYPVGEKVSGRIVNLMPYGAFVELEEGVEGLIHVSEMSWVKKINKASDILNVGDEVEAVVLDLQREQQKISLGLRQTMENPWEVIASKFPKGTKIKGKVRNMTSYGAFVQIQDDIDGMIHVSDMSWTRKTNNPNEVLQKGKEVEAIILEVDPSQQRISLGLKQLHEDPWAKIDDYYKVNDFVEGKVTKLASFGAFVELEQGIDGLIHISQLSEERVAKVKDVLTIGDVVKARVVKIDVNERRIGLSLKTNKEDNNFDAAIDKQTDSKDGLKRGDAMVDLGNVFDDAFSQMKEETAKENEEVSETVETVEEIPIVETAESTEEVVETPEQPTEEVVEETPVAETTEEVVEAIEETPVDETTEEVVEAIEETPVDETTDRRSCRSNRRNTR